jgi:hypothetical protein
MSQYPPPPDGGLMGGHASPTNPYAPPQLIHSKGGDNSGWRGKHLPYNSSFGKDEEKK